MSDETQDETQDETPCACDNKGTRVWTKPKRGLFSTVNLYCDTVYDSNTGSLQSPRPQSLSATMTKPTTTTSTAPWGIPRQSTTSSISSTCSTPATPSSPLTTPPTTPSSPPSTFFLSTTPSPSSAPLSTSPIALSSPRSPFVAVKRTQHTKNSRVEKEIFEAVHHITERGESIRYPKFYGSMVCQCKKHKEDLLLIQEGIPLSLKEWMLSKHSVKEWYNMLAQVIQGLATLVRNDIIDYDPNVGNILYYAQTDRWVITDFNLASIPSKNLSIRESAFGYEDPSSLKDELCRYSRRLYSYPILRFFKGVHSEMKRTKCKSLIPPTINNYFDEVLQDSPSCSALLHEGKEDYRFTPENASYHLTIHLLHKLYPEEELGKSKQIGGLTEQQQHQQDIVDSEDGTKTIERSALTEDFV